MADAFFPGGRLETDPPALRRFQPLRKLGRVHVDRARKILGNSVAVERHQSRLTSLPLLITAAGRSSRVTSRVGSPVTATRSPKRPTAIVPTSLVRPSASAALRVTDWIASSGVIPYCTMVRNCLAI